MTVFYRNTILNLVDNTIDNRGKDGYSLFLKGFPHSISFDNNLLISDNTSEILKICDGVNSCIYGESSDITITNNQFQISSFNQGRSISFFDIIENPTIDYFYTIQRSYIIKDINTPTNISISDGPNAVFVINSQIRSLWDEVSFESAIDNHQTLNLPRNRKIISPIVSNVFSSYVSNSETYNLDIQLTIDQPLFENDYYTITADNAPFVVEVYQSNYKGDLLERIAVEQYGYSQYNTLQTLNISGLESLSQWIAITLSAGIDTQGNTSDDPIGTSEPLVIPIINEEVFDEEICIDEGDQY